MPVYVRAVPDFMSPEKTIGPVPTEAEEHAAIRSVLMDRFVRGRKHCLSRFERIEISDGGVPSILGYPSDLVEQLMEEVKGGAGTSPAGMAAFAAALEETTKSLPPAPETQRDSPGLCYVPPRTTSPTRDRFPHPTYLQALQEAIRDEREYVPVCPFCGEKQVRLFTFAATCDDGIAVEENGCDLSGATLNLSEEEFGCAACEQPLDGGYIRLEPGVDYMAELLEGQGE